LLGDLHVNQEELKQSGEHFRDAETAIDQLKKSDLDGEDVQFSSAQLFNSRAVAFETQGLLDQQLKYLENARNTYVALIGTAAKANRIRYRQKLARTYYNLGRAYDGRCQQGLSDDWERVVSAYDKAVSGLESLRDDASGDRELELAVIQELAQTLQERSSGRLGYHDATTGEAKLGHKKQAIRDAEASVALCQVLVEKAPRNPQYRVDRIYARMTRATLYPPDQAGNTEAEKLYLAGITVLETIVEEHQIPAHRSLLADARTNLGVIYQDWPPTRLVSARKRVAQAQEQFSSAMKQAEHLHTQFPGLATYQVALAYALRDMADLVKARDGAAAGRFAKRGLRLIKPLLTRFPSRRDYKNLADDLEAIGR
jgi:tetratricopeptide (TPR) repeat protein